MLLKKFEGEMETEYAFLIDDRKDIVLLDRELGKLSLLKRYRLGGAYTDRILDKIEGDDLDDGVETPMGSTLLMLGMFEWERCDVVQKRLKHFGITLKCDTNFEQIEKCSQRRQMDSGFFSKKQHYAEANIYKNTKDGLTWLGMRRSYTKAGIRVTFEGPQNQIMEYSMRAQSIEQDAEDDLKEGARLKRKVGNIKLLQMPKISPQKPCAQSNHLEGTIITRDGLYEMRGGSTHPIPTDSARNVRLSTEAQNQEQAIVSFLEPSVLEGRFKNEIILAVKTDSISKLGITITVNEKYRFFDLTNQPVVALNLQDQGDVQGPQSLLLIIEVDSGKKQRIEERMCYGFSYTKAKFLSPVGWSEALREHKTLEFFGRKIASAAVTGKSLDNYCRDDLSTGDKDLYKETLNYLQRDIAKKDIEAEEEDEFFDALGPIEETKNASKQPKHNDIKAHHILLVAACLAVAAVAVYSIDSETATKMLQLATVVATVGVGFNAFRTFSSAISTLQSAESCFEATKEACNSSNLAAEAVTQFFASTNKDILPPTITMVQSVSTNIQNTMKLVEGPLARWNGVTERHTFI